MHLSVDTPAEQPGPALLADGLLNALPCAVLVLDEQAVVRGANAQAARWSAALVGRPLAQAGLPPALGAALPQLLEPGAAPREVWVPELAQWLELSAARQPGGWVLCGQNVTAQKHRAEQYRALAENTPDALCRWGADLRLRYANAAFADRVGRPLPALLGCTLGEMGVPADVAVPYLAALRRAFATGQAQEHYHPCSSPGHPDYCYSRLVPELCAGRVETVLGTARDITALEQRQAAALQVHSELAQQATNQYYALFCAMDQGCSVQEIIFDETGQRAVDFRYLSLNPVFMQQSGIPATAQGKLVSEVLPEMDSFWCEAYGRVALTGATVRVERYVHRLGRWFDMHAFRVGAAEARQVAALFTDITERKQVEEQLRLATAADNLRLQLADALGPLTSPADIQATAAQVLGQYLGVDHAYYADVHKTTQALVVARAWHRPGAPAPPLPAALATGLAPQLAGGHPWVCHDVDTHPGLPAAQRADYRGREVRALLVVPLLKHGRLVASLIASQRTPRAWTPQQVALAKEIAERTCATVERAKAEEALRAREERYRTDLEGQVLERTTELQQSRDLLQATMDSTLDMIQVFEAVRDEAGQIVDFRWLLNNHAAESRYGQVLGQRLLERNPGVVPEGIFADFKRVVETGEPRQSERHYAHEQFDGWFLQSVVKLGDGVATSTKEVTDWKNAQAEVLRLRLSQQQTLFEAVQNAQEAERHRIAEALHNGLGQLLYATKLRLDQLRLAPSAAPPEWQPAHRAANQLLSEAIHQTRVLSHELVPMALEEFGLAAALQDVCHKLSGPSLHLRAQVQLEADLAPALQLALYRMAQELTQNIVKHARGATEASLELEAIPGWVLLRVEDNGPGFATALLPDAGLGLRSIRDQVALLGGVIQVGTFPSGGAYVRIRLPLRAA